MFAMATSLILVLLSFLMFFSPSSSIPRDDITALAKIASNPELTEMHGVIERSKYRSHMENYPSTSTLFTPTNEAFQKYKGGPRDDILVGYHIIANAYNLEDLQSSEPTIGTAPVYITKVNDKEYYVNNAKVLKNFSMEINVPSEADKKVIHVINEVLQPLRKREGVMKSYSTAYQLLESSQQYELANNKIGAFFNRVTQMNKMDNFKSSASAANTYFIPVDDNIVRNNRLNSIDGKVIDAHVIFNKVLFLNPTPENVDYETGAFSDSLKVLASFSRYVRSRTVVGDRGHSSGSVISEIILPNIPVRNGVVHLIKQPLMIIDKTVQEFINDESNDGLIGTFKEKLKYAGDVFRQKLAGQQPVTLFIPTNAAWKDLNVEITLSNNTNLLQHILDLHMVSDRLSINEIRDRRLTEAPSLWKEKFLYFNMIIQGWNRTLTVEGGGGNATVLHADLGAVNGVIHIIDRVLGIPYATVARKIATDPILNYTYTFGNIPYTHDKHLNFNERLDDLTKNFTYFVPRDAAWQLFNRENPELFGALYKGGVASKILERHLIEGHNYTMADLKKLLNNGTYLLQTSNGGLNMKVREHGKGYSILWNDEPISVYRADIRCTNGIIHVIDKVLIAQKDNIQIPISAAFRNYLSWQLLFLSVLPFGMMVINH